jgi:hypothetical protein
VTSLLEATLAAAVERAARSSRAALRSRGVVVTPIEVARHALAHVDTLLRCELAIEDGLASRDVEVLDPAVGTGIWLAAVLELTRARYGHSHALLRGIDVEAGALPALHALLAPEAAAQGASLALSCANTLELASCFAASPRVRVIVGNPPWAARSLSRGGPLSDRWLAEFRSDAEGRSLGERRSGVLSDDYVRFFRWALEQARTAPAGALICLATNASYLDGPVHRGMRAALLSAFDRLDVLDLGGNSLLSRTGAPDHNLFGVRVGAALCWAVRTPQRGARTPLVHYASLQGGQRDKLAALADEPRAQVVLVPEAPWYAFRPVRAASALDGFSLDEAFVFHREGVQSNRDALAIAGTRAELEQRLRRLAAGELPLVGSPHFDPERARLVVRNALERAEPCIAELAYRPLDDRFFVTLAPLCHRPRPELAKAVAHSSISLLAVRKERGAALFNLFAATTHMADACFLSTRSSCRTRVFPSHLPDGRENLSPSFAAALASRLGSHVSSAALIEYVLGVLGSPRFRREHEHALKRDYARVPWPADAATFACTAAAGRAFVAALAEPTCAPLPFQIVCSRLPHEHVSAAGLTYCERARTVSQAGRILLADVEAGWWDARIGQFSFVESALSAPRGAQFSTLVGALQRAARWSRAEQASDALRSA